MDVLAEVSEKSTGKLRSLKTGKLRNRRDVRGVSELLLDGLVLFPLEAPMEGLLSPNRGKRNEFFPLAFVAVAPVAVVVDGRSLSFKIITTDSSGIIMSSSIVTDDLVVVMLRMLLSCRISPTTRRLSTDGYGCSLSCRRLKNTSCSRSEGQVQPSNYNLAFVPYQRFILRTEWCRLYCVMPFSTTSTNSAPQERNSPALPASYSSKNGRSMQ